VSNSRNRYLVVGCKTWNRRLFDECLSKFPGEWKYAGEPAELSLEAIREFRPRYAFFLHWSWKVPVEILEEVECVCFHMTDVPYGRGGSPLQNLIVRGHRNTKLTALRMIEQFDAGPVYLKRDLSLEGGAEEIFLRANTLSAEMIRQIAHQETKALAQAGDPVNFRRRKPEESKIENVESLEKLHDFIRMLDADGYPRAFFNYGGLRFEFSRSALYDRRVVADVQITWEPKEPKE
jgi:methionyl-tRNA formyltransferase